MAERHRTTTAVALACALSAAPFGMPRPARADVSVGSTMHGSYDACIAKIRGAGMGGMVDGLDASRHRFTVDVTDKNHYTKSNPDDRADAGNGVGTGGTTLWWPTPSNTFADGTPEDGCATLVHEMKHLSDYDAGTNSGESCHYDARGRDVDAGISIAEVGATQVENDYRARMHLPLRTKFGNIGLPPAGTTCKPPPPKSPSGGCNVSAVGCPSQTGRSFGDPHILTYDGYAYPLQSAGEFVLTRSVDGSFEVQMRAVPVPNRDDLTLNTAVVVRSGTHRIALYATGGPNGGRLVRRDGAAVFPKVGESEALPGGGTMTASQNDLVIDVPTGERVALHTSETGTFAFVNANVTVPQSGRAYVGVLGAGDGDRRHELRTRDGKSTPLANAYGDAGRAIGVSSVFPAADAAFHAFVNRTFANSWRISQAESLFDYAPGTSTRTFTDLSYPRRDFTADAGSWASAADVCRKAGVAGDLLPGCAVDVSATKSAVFAQAASHLQSLVTGALELPVDRVRTALPNVPSLPVPGVPSIRFPHF